MKLKYMGAYNGDPDSLPCEKHYPNAKLLDIEGVSYDKLINVLNIISALVMIVLFVLFGLISEFKNFDLNGSILGLILLVPHELLHAICFKGEVFLYLWIKKGCMFVIGPEPISKMRFIFMSLLPNLCFGFLPFIIYICNPNMTLLGSMGVITIGMGVGDYYNVINAIKLMPKGSKAYCYKANTYWYIPDNQQA